MTPLVKESPATVAAETGNPLLDTFEYAMSTLWDTPEISPLPKSPHTRQIFDRLHRMCRDGIPEPDIMPGEQKGELHVLWEEGDKAVHLHIDVSSLRTLVVVGDISTMESTGTERWLRSENDWKHVEQELRHALRYRGR